MCDNAFDICNALLNDCEVQGTNFSDEKKIKKHFQHNFVNLFLEG